MINIWHQHAYEMRIESDGRRLGLCACGSMLLGENYAVYLEEKIAQHMYIAQSLRHEVQAIRMQFK